MLLSTGTWLMVVMSVWAQSLIQQAFRHANAASVSAVNAVRRIARPHRGRFRPVRREAPQRCRRRLAGRRRLSSRLAAPSC